MNLPDYLIPTAWQWAANSLAILLLVYSIIKAPWKHLSPSALQHVFLGSIVTLLILWTIKAGIRPGLNIHLLGATVLCLMFRWQLALIAMATILLGHAAFNMTGWHALGINFLIMAAIPVAFSYNLFRLVDSKLPNHLVIYIFVCGFLCAGLTINMCGLSAVLALIGMEAYPGEYLRDHYLPYYILIGWSEALLTGMAVTLMTAFRPHWLMTFNDTRYLKTK
ncbi:energy-coupling factor ABC transporter permease [Methylobacillus gramineus]|uniref:energy-coupling factor ABC transporter permease n=1 Tax=Methylobacillus gramineus TaxID=755169 RepID=UPI001CFFC977|nr:energy-coupling factor ABC transporter permease [Methylobacillus gramineus]MCB5185156.1 energy-coupling factor ABC transporter permease [Methylobacillus gramineus]